MTDADIEESAAGDDGTLVLRRTVLKFTGASAAAAAVGASATGSAGAQQSGAEIVFEDQTIDGTSVTIDSATLPDGGYISLQDPTQPARQWRDQHDVDYFEATVLGQTEFLDPGSHSDVTLELAAEDWVRESTPLQVWLHPDTNDNEEFDYVESGAEEDFGYFFLAENPVVADAALTVESVPSTTTTTTTTSTTTATETPTEPPATTTAGDGGGGGLIPGFGAATAVAGVVIGAAAAAYRRVRGETDK